MVSNPEWGRIAATLALSGEAENIIAWGSDVKGRNLRTINLVDPKSERIVDRRLIEDLHYQRIIVPITVQVPRNISPMFEGEDQRLPTAGIASYQTESSTWEAVDPDDPECKWFFWVEGSRGWESWEK